MNNRLINILVDGSHLTKDRGTAGVQHEGNSTVLRIKFDESWDNLAKSVTWWNAKGLNPVVRVLTVDMLEDIQTDTRIYRCPIPAEPLTEAGMCTFVIDGFLEGKRQRSISDQLKVTPAPYAANAGAAADPTPTQAEQLQVQIDSFKGEIQTAVIASREAVQSAEDARKSAEAAAEEVVRAEIAASEAASYTSHPPVVNADTGYWQEWDGEKYVDTEHYSVGAQGVKGERGFRGEQGVQGIQGEIGPQGIQGIQGPEGVQGIKGDVGPQGATGPQGAQGIQGVRGDKGDRGDKGATGDTGATGSIGPQGEQGLQGIQGPRGETGPQGAEGPRGPQGIQGPQGVQGPQGISGVMVETAGYVNFSVTADGILQCTYTGGEAPAYSIDANGHLILTV